LFTSPNRDGHSACRSFSINLGASLPLLLCCFTSWDIVNIRFTIPFRGLDVKLTGVEEAHVVRGILT
jgi:hypothetical protein